MHCIRHLSVEGEDMVVCIAKTCVPSVLSDSNTIVGLRDLQRVAALLS